MQLGDLRRETEEQISRHRETVSHELHIIATKSRFLNDLVPVTKLFPEILADIFIYFAADPFSYGEYGCSTGPYSWIVVTHVCHRWREVALGTPKLWSFLHLGTPERVEEFLARSSHALLHVRPWSSHSNESQVWGWGYSNSRPMQPSASAASLKLILAQSPRIQTISLALPNNVLERAFSIFNANAGGFYAPALRTLKFISTHPSSFPNILNKCRLPKLMHIELRGYGIPWHLSFFRTNLRSLVLHNIMTSPPNNSDTVGNLLTALSHMQALELLEVVCEYCNGACESIRAHGSFHSVDLPCLQTLRVRLDAASIDVILSHCTFPSTTTIAFKTDVRHAHGWGPFGTIQEDVSDEDKCNVLRSIIRKSVDIPGQITSFTGLSIHFDSLQPEPNPHYPNSPGVQPNEMTLTTYTFDPSLGQLQVDEILPPANFTIRFSFRRGGQAPTMLQKLLLDLPLSNVVYLNVGSSTICRVSPIAKEMASFLAELIGRCSPSGLDILRMSGPSIDVLRFLMSQPTQDGLDERSFEPGPTLGDKGLFGCLRSLMLSDMRAGPDWNAYDGVQTHNLFDSIRTEAQRYKWSCGRFSSLILQRCEDQREWALDLVDAFSELFCQEGRFTQDLPQLPYIHMIQSPPSPPLTPYPEPAPWLPDDYPDSDLDRYGWSPMTPFVPPATGDWVDHLLYGRVTFDYRGNGGVTTEQNVTATVEVGQFL